MRNLIIASTLVLTALPSSAAVTQVRADDRFVALAEEAWRMDGSAGVTIGIVRGGVLVRDRSFGFADVEAGTRPDGRTIYRVASVTKAFTALAYLQLVERGVIRPTDPVTRFVPEFRAVTGLPAGSAPPSLVQLATHTSGLDAEPEGEGLDQGPPESWERKTLAGLPRARYASGPGTRFGYSNLGYAVLALAVSRATRQPFPAYVRDHITAPLGMIDTGFRPVDPSRLARGYTATDGRATPVQDVARGYKLPAGGLYTTLADMAKFVAFQMENGPDAVLPRASLDAASRNLITVDRSMGEAYGTGFQLFSDGDVVLQGHGGGFPGWRALEVFDRRSMTGYIVLRNATGGKFGDPVLLVLGALRPS